MTNTARQQIESIEAFPLNVPLLAPFTIATARLDHVNNVVVRVRLHSGAEGWGEIPSLHPVTTEDQPTALTAVREIAPQLTGHNAAAWSPLAANLATALPTLAATRAGIEMAILDALTTDWGIPLYQFFGGASDHLTTDITIPICPPDEARTLAATYSKQGFNVIKTKVGLDLHDDVSRLAAIRDAHPTCALVLDSNEGYTADEALAFLAALRSQGIEPALFEQPVAREDWDGLGRVTREGSVPVAADESCRSPQDALLIAQGNLATVLNIKLVKCGVVGALEIAAIARAAGLGLMIGGMVETRIAMGFAAHFAAGLGGFDWIDLDTPLLLAENPVSGGYTADGPHYSLATTSAGHGGTINLTA
jgi:L-alanine-DL-glutamate epimerase-like enolase superfamily enzyme